MTSTGQSRNLMHDTQYGTSNTSSYSTSMSTKPHPTLGVPDPLGFATSSPQTLSRKATTRSDKYGRNSPYVMISDATSNDVVSGGGTLTRIQTRRRAKKSEPTASARSSISQVYTARRPNTSDQQHDARGTRNVGDTDHTQLHQSNRPVSSGVGTLCTTAIDDEDGPGFTLFRNTDPSSLFARQESIEGEGYTSKTNTGGGFALTITTSDVSEPSLEPLGTGYKDQEVHTSTGVASHSIQDGGKDAETTEMASNTQPVKHTHKSPPPA